MRDESISVFSFYFMIWKIYYIYNMTVKRENRGAAGFQLEGAEE